MKEEQAAAGAVPSGTAGATPTAADGETAAAASQTGATPEGVVAADDTGTESPAGTDDGVVVPGANPPPPPPATPDAPEALRVCSNCGTANNPSRKFCMKCGTKLPEGEVEPQRICPNCSTPNAPTRRFCMKCGTTLVETPPPTSESTTEWWRKT